MNVTAMCASGNAAMLTAKMWLDAGVASDVIVVASDLSATPENIRHFRNLGRRLPRRAGARGLPARSRRARRGSPAVRLRSAWSCPAATRARTPGCSAAR